MDYQKAYKLQSEKLTQTGSKLANANREIFDLQMSLGKIKNSFFWKVSKPLRMFAHVFIRIHSLIRRFGSLRRFFDKVKAKLYEKKVSGYFGTKSFPGEIERKKQEEMIFSKDITISILVPLYNTPIKYLTEMLDSVMTQTFQKWELCLADGSDYKHPQVEKICREYAVKNARIKYEKLEKNLGIAGNTNACFAMATGDYIALFDHDDILHPSVLYRYMVEICQNDADYIYCDEATFVKGNIDKMVTLHFKSDFAIDTLRANNYICHFSMFSRKLLEGTMLFRPEFDGSQDHDMILRLTQVAKNVVHIPKILYYWRSHKGSVAGGIGAKTYAILAAKEAIADHLTQNGYANFRITSTKACETIFRIEYELEARPLISILIPNKDHCVDLRRCIHSILEDSTYEQVEILVIENNSTEPDIFAYYKELEKEERVKVINFLGEFNYAAINNVGAKSAKGEYLILLNNDTKVMSVNWIEELLMYAQRPDVGAVGAKLWYENNTIQHAGVVIGLGAHKTAGHTHYGVGRENVGYMGKLYYAQDVTAVTGACLMVRKKLYEELGGLDETFKVALNDVDFCLRLRKAGYLNVMNPYCELYHYESISRGLDDLGDKAKRYEEEASRFREKWKEELTKGDPYYNPNFSLDRSDYSIRMVK